MKISSCGEQSVISDEEENVTTVACSMAYGQSPVLSYHVFHYAWPKY
jgi:hypothetical protein